MTDTSKLSNIAAMKAFFERDGGKKIHLPELKPLTDNDKQELGDLCRAALAQS